MLSLIPAYPQMLPYKDVNTKHPDFVLTSANTSIKVIVLPLTYAMYH